MIAYLEKVKAELEQFSKYKIKYIGCKENTNTGALAKLTTSKDGELLHLVLVEIIAEPNIAKQHKVEVINKEYS